MARTYKGTRIACYIGYFVQAIIINLPPVLFIIFQKQLGISYSLLSLLIIVNFAVQFVADIISIKLAQKLGERKCILWAHIFSFFGMCLLGILPMTMNNSYLGLVIALTVASIGCGMIEVLISPVVSNLPSDDDAGDMSLLHSFYCWGQVTVILVTTLLLALKLSWWMIPVLWAVIPFVNFFNFLNVPIVEQTEKQEKLSFKVLFKSKHYLVFLILMLCAGATEMTMSQWASMFMEISLNINKALGDVMGPCVFALFMGIGRTVCGIYGNKIDMLKTLLVASLGCFVAYVIAAVSGLPILSLGAFALCGLSVSIMWPGIFSACAEKFKAGSTAMFAYLALFGDTGCATGPAVTGFLTDFSQNVLHFNFESLRFGLICSSVFPLVMFLILLYINYRKN